jgi:hypothetical protein
VPLRSLPRTSLRWSAWSGSRRGSPLDALQSRRLDVVHGSLDRWLPGIPGVSPALSRRGFDRARSLGVEGNYELIPGALHAVALRAPGGRLLPLPRAHAWGQCVAAQLATF